MLLFHSKKRFLLISTLVLLALHALNTVFLSYVIGQVISAATNSSMDDFLLNSGIGVGGFILFMVIGILLAKTRALLIKDINLVVKRVVINETLRQLDYRDDYTKALSFLTNDLKQLETKGIEGELNIFYLGATYLFSLVGAFFIDPFIALSFLCGSLLVVALSFFLQAPIRKSASEWSTTNATYTKLIKNLLNGFETIKTYQVEEEISDKAYNTATNMESSLAKMNYKVEVSNQLVYIAMMLFGILLPFSFGIYRVIDGHIALGSFIAIVYLSNGLRSPALQLLQNINGYKTTKVIKDKYVNLASGINNVYHQEKATPFSSIELRDVHFTFANKVIFNSKNFAIENGDRILIIGKSGIGKSTILRLIQKTLPLTSGQYLYNGKESETPISDIFSLIRQQPLVFDDSLRFNLTLGEEYSEQELDDVILKVGLKELVKDVGLAYLIGENGVNLSTGQLQRIEIGRALLRKRPIILADEITSALDNETATSIRELLYSSTVTLVEVAHNVAIKDRHNYNKIWQLD